MNVWAIILATIVTMVISFLWYSNALFIRPWYRSLGMSDKEFAKNVANMTTRARVKQMGLMTLATVVSAIALSWIIDTLGFTTAGWGAATGLVLWLGFVVTSCAVPVLFEGRPSVAYVISMGQYFVTMPIMGAILAVWR